MKNILMTNLLLFFLVLTLSAQNDKELIIRCDDIGMNHDVNIAFEKVLKTGVPASASLMVPCPWFQEAVEIINKYENASAGLHLTLNAEWKNYRWGPVSGPSIVPSLVDSLGYFFPSREKLFANNPKTSEVEIELRAQIKRAQDSGLKIDYLDYHMGAAVQTPELRSLVENLAKEYGFGISQYFREDYSSATYFAKIGSKTDSLVERISKIEPGTLALQVFHISLNTPEMKALTDLNPFGPKDMSDQRADELNALLSDRFQNAIKDNNIKLVNYRDIIAKYGLKNMQKPTQAY